MLVQVIGYSIAAITVVLFSVGVARLIRAQRGFEQYLASNHPQFLERAQEWSPSVSPLSRHSVAWLLFQTDEDLGDPRLGEWKRRIRSLVSWNIAAMIGTGIVPTRALPATQPGLRPGAPPAGEPLDPRQIVVAAAPGARSPRGDQEPPASEAGSGGKAVGLTRLTA